MADKGKMSMWLRFFRDAGIPSGFDTKYALVFDENRIKMDMLMDINKECLRDMGITAMGDIISIVKHAKKVHDEYKTQAYEVPRPTSSTVSKNLSSVEEGSPPSSGSSSSSSASSASGGPRSVIINNKLANKSSTLNAPKQRSVVSNKPSTSTSSDRSSTIQIRSSSQAKTILLQSGSRNFKSQQDCDSTEGNRIKNTIVRLKRSVSPETVQKEEVPFQKKIRVPREQEGKYTIIMPEGTTPKTQKLLQDRLGPSIKPVSGADKKTNVFSRLGGTSDVRVSSSTEVKSPQNIDGDGSSEKKSKTNKPSQPSVFSRLGQGKNLETKPMSSPPAAPVPVATGSEFLKTKFTIKQAIDAGVDRRRLESLSPSPPAPVRVIRPITAGVDRRRLKSRSPPAPVRVMRSITAAVDRRRLKSQSPSPPAPVRVMRPITAGVDRRRLKSRSPSPLAPVRVMRPIDTGADRRRLKSPPAPVRMMPKYKGSTDQIQRDREYLLKLQSSLERRFVNPDKTPTSQSESPGMGRDSSIERPNSSGNVSSSSSRMRLSMDGNGSDSVSVKSRLGTRRSEGASRSRSPSPPPKRRLGYSDGYSRTVPSTNSEISVVKGVRQQLVAPIRSNSTGGSSQGKVVSRVVVKKDDSPTSKAGKVVREERYRNSEGKLFIRRTIMKKVVTSKRF